jgi:hypothetical protein
MKKEKKAQVTLFIIVGVVIIVVIALLFFLYVKKAEVPESKELPEIKNQIESCIKESVEKSSLKLVVGNGYIQKTAKNDFNFSYPVEHNKQGSFNEVPLLCYTEEIIDCIILEPNFVEHVRLEIENDAEAGIKKCFDSAKEEVESQKYKFMMEDMLRLGYSVTFAENEIRVFVKRKIEISGGEAYKSYDSFNAVVKSPVYEIALITHEILEEESKYASANTNEIQKKYKFFDIGRYVLTDEGIKVYTIVDTRTNQQIMFGVKGGINRPAYT